VNKGGTVHFKVSTTASLFQMNVYRMGYYGGMAPGEWRPISNVTGKSQAACLTNATTHLVDCGNWTESTTWTVPATAVSGIYFAKLTRTDTGGSSHIVFIVRDDASTSDLLLQTSDTHGRPITNTGVQHVSGNTRARFQSELQPPVCHSRTGHRLRDVQLGVLCRIPDGALGSNPMDTMSLTSPCGRRSQWCADQEPQSVPLVGHDEYWSGIQRTNVEAARAAGVHLAFFSGNELFWKTRFESSIDGSNTAHRTLVTYKETHADAVIDPLDPPTWTGTWQDPRFSPPADGGRPGNSLSGQFFSVNRGTAPIKVPSIYSQLRFWRNTAVAQLASGQVTTLATDTLGYEWDQDGR